MEGVVIVDGGGMLVFEKAWVEDYGLPGKPHPLNVAAYVYALGKLVDDELRWVELGARKIHWATRVDMTCAVFLRAEFGDRARRAAFAEAVADAFFKAEKKTNPDAALEGLVARELETRVAELSTALNGTDWQLAALAECSADATIARWTAATEAAVSSSATWIDLDAVKTDALATVEPVAPRAGCCARRRKIQPLKEANFVVAHRAGPAKAVDRAVGRLATFTLPETPAPDVRDDADFRFAWGEPSRGRRLVLAVQRHGDPPPPSLLGPALAAATAAAIALFSSSSSSSV